VIVLDDVASVSAPKLDFLRRLVRAERCRLVAVTEAFLPAQQMAELRSVPVAGRPMRLGPLGLADAERFFDGCRAGFGLPWSQAEVHSLAVASHGFPLGMRELMSRELRRNAAIHPGTHLLDTRKELTP
jgi:hypothetical protein